MLFNKYNFDYACTVSYAFPIYRSRTFRAKRIFLVGGLFFHPTLSRFRSCSPKTPSNAIFSKGVEPAFVFYIYTYIYNAFLRKERPVRPLTLISTTCTFAIEPFSTLSVGG